MTRCHAIKTLDVRLSQIGIDCFEVQYGRQIRSNLTYGAAALEYGGCIMHALACLGLLDNREPGEDEDPT